MENDINIVCSQESKEYFAINCFHVAPAVSTLERFYFVRN